MDWFFSYTKQIKDWCTAGFASSCHRLQAGLKFIKIPCQTSFRVVKVVQGGTAILPCYVTDTNDDLTQISWQRRTRENPRNYIFFTASYSDGDRPQFFNEQFKFIGNFKDKNGTLQLFNVTLKDEGSYTCIFTLVPSGNQKTEMPLKVFVPPFTSVKDNLPTLGTEEVLFATCTAAGSRPPAEVRWLTGALADRVRTTRNYIHYDNGMTTTVSSLFGVPTGDINGHKVQCVISGDSLSKEETLPFTIQIYCEEVNIKAISGDSFECVTEANPNANFTWSRVEGAKLQLLSLTSDLNGLYQCEASNKYGRKHGQLYVHVPSGEVSLDLPVQFVWGLFSLKLRSRLFDDIYLTITMY
uniref:Ig-like domain-containing protein n=1 Tax=Oreochromis niloticus TaxID=8128 RepID=I3JRB2_ORENI